MLWFVGDDESSGTAGDLISHVGLRRQQDHLSMRWRGWQALDFISRVDRRSGARSDPVRVCEAAFIVSKSPPHFLAIRVDVVAHSARLRYLVFPVRSYP